MNLTAIMPVRNEDWCLNLTLRAALAWTDQVIVGLHACTDASADIALRVASEHPDRVNVLRFDEDAWLEMEHRHALLTAARGCGATHVAIVDADEVLTSNLISTIRDHVAHCPPGHILQLPGYNLRGGLTRYHANGIWANRVFSFAFTDSPELHWGGDRFHHREPMGLRLHPWRLVPHGKGGIMHLWGASERRLKAKHALYKLTERLRWPHKPLRDIDRMYSLAVHGDASVPAAAWTFSDVPPDWWLLYGELLQYVDLHSEPWQVAECERLLKAHPGLDDNFDLFGIVEA